MNLIVTQMEELLKKAYRNPVRGKETNAEKQFHKSQAVNGTTVSLKEEAAA